MPMFAEAASGIRVAMLVRNPVINDSRVLKEARTLIDAGYQVRVFGLADHEFPGGATEVDGIPITRVRADLGEGRFHLGSLLATARTVLVEQFRQPRLPQTGVTRLNSQSALKRSIPNAQINESVAHTQFDYDAFNGFDLLAEEMPGTMTSGAPSVACRMLKRLLAPTLHLVKRGRRRLYLRLAAIARPLGIAHLGRSFAIAATPYVAQWSPNVVHCHDAECGLAAIRLSDSPTTFMVYDSHELWLKRNTPAHKGAVGALVLRWESRVEEQLVKCSDLVITVNPGIARVMELQYGLPEGSVAVVRNVPVAVPQPSGSIDLNSFRDFADQFLIAYSGRITNNRLLWELIDAVSHLRTKHVAVVFVGYGSAHYVEGIQRHAQEMGVRLTIVGPVPSDSVAQTLSTADVVFVGVEPVVDSYTLALPNKFFEALMSERPVLFPALSEMLKITHDTDGTFPFDPDDLSSLRLQLDEALQVASGSSYVRNRNFSWRSEADVLLGGYALIAEEVPG